jgi:hypothetical protein
VVRPLERGAERHDLHLDVLASTAKPNRPPAVPASTQPMNTRHVSLLPLGTGEVAARLWEVEDLQAGSLCGLAARDFRHSGQPCLRPHEPSGQLLGPLRRTRDPPATSQIRRDLPLVAADLHRS